MNDNDKRAKWDEFLEEYKIYMKITRTGWYKILDEVKLWIDANNKRPSPTGKTETEKKFGMWLSMQKVNYKNHSAAMNNNDKRKKWADFTEEYKNYLITSTKWFDTLDKLKKWIDENGKRPSSIAEDETEKNLGNWILNQQTKYKKNIYTMKDKNLRTTWEDFVRENDNFFDTSYLDKKVKPKKIIKKTKDAMLDDANSGEYKIEKFKKTKIGIDSNIKSITKQKILKKKKDATDSDNEAISAIDIPKAPMKKKTDIVQVIKNKNIVKKDVSESDDNEQFVIRKIVKNETIKKVVAKK